MELTTLRACPVPGEGIVARLGVGALLVLPDAGSELTGALISIISATGSAATSPGRQMARRLAQLLGEHQGELPSFAALAPDADGLVAIVCGQVTLTTSRDGQVRERISGTDAAAWVDRMLREETDEILLAREGSPPPEPTPYEDLTQGVVTGAGLLFTARAAVAETTSPATQGDIVLTPVSPEAAASAPEPESAPAADTSVPEPQSAPAADTRVPEPQSAPAADTPPPEPGPAAPATPTADRGQSQQQWLPPSAAERVAAATAERPPEEPASGVEVMGVRCQNGHFLHPKALYCNRDGTALTHVTRVEVRGIRPPLGMLVLDNGSNAEVVRDAIVGSDPTRHPEVAAHRLEGWQLQDAHGGIAPVHAEVRLIEWDLTVVDLGSPGGTWLWRPNATAWERVAPGGPVVVPPGARIGFGQRIVAFESYHL